MLELLKVKSLLFIQNDAILFLLLVAEERGERRTSCKRCKKVGNSGRKTRLFAEYIFTFINKLPQKAGKFLYEVQKKINNNKILKKKTRSSRG